MKVSIYLEKFDDANPKEFNTLVNLFNPISLNLKSNFHELL